MWDLDSPLSETFLLDQKKWYGKVMNCYLIITIIIVYVYVCYLAQLRIWHHIHDFIAFSNAVNLAFGADVNWAVNKRNIVQNLRRTEDLRVNAV